MELFRALKKSDLCTSNWTWASSPTDTATLTSVSAISSWCSACRAWWDCPTRPWRWSWIGPVIGDIRVWRAGPWATSRGRSWRHRSSRVGGICRHVDEERDRTGVCSILASLRQTVILESRLKIVHWRKKGSRG